MARLLTIRPMTGEDLESVGRWLEAPHVARWFLPETTAASEVERYRQRIEDPTAPTRMCTVEVDGRPIGWCQWYRWYDFPDSAVCVAAHDGEIGLDYAIGELEEVGHGSGTAMIEAILAHVRPHAPEAGFVVSPESANLASRRVLEKNGFELVGVKPLACEPHTRPMAIYRLAGRP